LDWNGPGGRPFVRFRDDGLNRPIIGHVEHACRRNPERIAIRDADCALTYGELWSGVCGLAETLSARATPEGLVGILLPAGPLFPLAMLACLAAGRAFVVLDSEYPGEWLDHVLRDAQPTLILASDNLSPDVEARLSGIPVIHLSEVPKPSRAGWRTVRLDTDEPACVLFTSGSTGRPKGIVNSQRNLLQRVAQSINAAHINNADRLLTLASPCTIVGVRDVLTALVAGASIHLLTPLGVGAREILNVIRAEEITVLFAFPGLLRSIVAARPPRASVSLRLVRVGGDTTLWSDVDRLRAWLAPGASIQSIYAATEAPMMQWFIDDACGGTDARVPIGYPLPDNPLTVIDENGREVAPGRIGELVVESRYVSLGHWIGGRLVKQPGESRGVRRFDTGDLVIRRPDGLIERVGRKDRQVKIRGSRVDLDGVEAAIRRHARVQDVAAFARTTGDDGAMTLVAYVSTRGESHVGLIEELTTNVQSLPPALRPARFYLVHEIPRLPSSKLDTRALAALDAAHARNECGDVTCEVEDRTVACDQIALAVAQTWKQVLRVPGPAREDDFFERGGDSLKAITFIMELERALGRELSPTLLNVAPRFGELCELLRTSRTPAHDLFVTLKPGEGWPPVFFIHGVGGNVVELLPTARRLRYGGAVIGIRARGLVRGETPQSSVYAMATDYLREIKAQQPTGPYHLCGYSFGGLVAFEIARRLRESGDEVGLVGLFDTLMSPVTWPLSAWLRMAGTRVARLGAPWRLLKHRPRDTERSELAAPRSAASNVIRVSASALFASARYRPGFYPGRLTLFTPRAREPGLPSLEAIWGKHAEALAVVETEGSHATMLSSPHADSTAEFLANSLKRARDR
jgi:acyl-coenzyme A synthetase/AMP-(fatty) acid ligase/thioesterase domain-containing protein/acyl carrier protein